MAWRCRERTCDERIRAEDYYCHDHWEALMGALEEVVGRVYDDAAKVYVGRTHFPECRLLEHRVKYGLTRMAVLHWAGCQDEIAEIEEELIDAFQNERKILNQSTFSDGGWGGHWNCIYVAWHPARRSRGWGGPRFQEVTTLDLGRRLVPDRSFARKPDYLETNLSASAARRAVERY